MSPVSSVIVKSSSTTVANNSQATKEADEFCFSNLSVPKYYNFTGINGELQEIELKATNGQASKKPQACLVTISQEPNSGKNAIQDSWSQEPKRTYGWQIGLYLLLLVGGVGVLLGGYFLLVGIGIAKK